MNVLAATERFDKTLLSGDVGQDAQLDLRVVGGEEAPAGLGNEGGANAASKLGTNGNVLQVRPCGGQSSRHRHQLVERGVDAARPWIDERRQRIGIRRLELGEGPMLDDLRRQLVAERQL